MKFGHFAREYTQQPNCRKCGQPHESISCTDYLTCVNCIISNENGTNYNTRHRATDDRCPVKQERLTPLKQLAMSKNA